MIYAIVGATLVLAGTILVSSAWVALEIRKREIPEDVILAFRSEPTEAPPEDLVVVGRWAVNGEGRVGRIEEVRPRMSIGQLYRGTDLEGEEWTTWGPPQLIDGYDAELLELVEELRGRRTQDGDRLNRFIEAHLGGSP